MIEFNVYGDPKSLKRHRDRKPVTKNGHTFTPKYDPSSGDKADFLAKAMEYKPRIPIEEWISVTIVAYFGRPKSHYNSKGVLKAGAPIWHTGTPDADNLIKFVGDSLNGIFWKDDKFISHVQCSKKYSDVPCMYIKIELL